MRRHSLFAPVTVLVIGLIIIIILLGTPYGQSSAAPSFAYTPAEQTATAKAYVSPTDRVATAKAQTATNANDNTNSNTAATSTVTTTTATVRPATIAPTVPAATRPGAPATAAAPTRPATTPTTLPTDTPLPSPTPLADFQCVPGVPVTIEGSGPPNSGILLLFNERIVSGGVTRSTGAFRMQLTVGDEDPGVYPVVVQVRGTEEQLLEKTCFVPAITPTPPPLGTGP